jgi:hypothetical protein
VRRADAGARDVARPHAHRRRHDRSAGEPTPRSLGPCGRSVLLRRPEEMARMDQRRRGWGGESRRVLRYLKIQQTRPQIARVRAHRLACRPTRVEQRVSREPVDRAASRR